MAVRGRRGCVPLACLLAAAAVWLVACGSVPTVPPPPAGSVAEREWIANAFRFIQLVESRVELAVAGGSSVAAARKALADPSDLYASLVAYTYFSGCNSEIASVGRPSARAQRVVRTLISACADLEWASTLFHLAVTRNRPLLLVRATRASESADPLLYRANAQLASIA